MPVMSFDTGPLDRYLHSAVGEDTAAAAELQAVFVRSVDELTDLMQRARCDANWTMAALRLKSLSATFGVVPLIELAEQAMARRLHILFFDSAGASPADRNNGPL